MKSPALSRGRGPKLKLIEPLSDPLWLKLIETKPSLLFHSPAWLQAIQKTYGFPIQALVLLQDQRPRAGLPFARVEDELGPRVVSLPFSDYCDPVFEKASELNSLICGLVKLFPGHEIKLRFLDAPSPSSRLGFQPVKTARWHGLRLAGSEQDLYGRLHPEARRAIKRADQHGLYTRRLKRGELPRFYEMHLAVRKNRYALLPQPLSWFENIRDQFTRRGQGFWLGAFTRDNQLIAAHCLLAWQDTLVYKFGASDYAFGEHGANHLLHWQAMRHGLKNGFLRLDLGLSDDDQPGLIRYKRHLGAAEKEIRFYSRRPVEPAPEAVAFQGALSELTRLGTGQEVPVALTAGLGDLLYRYFA